MRKRNPVQKFKGRKGHAYLSEEFIRAMRNGRSLNLISKEIGMSECTLNGWFTKLNRPSKTDPRIKLIAEKFNFPFERVFEDDHESKVKNLCGKYKGFLSSSDEFARNKEV